MTDFDYINAGIYLAKYYMVAGLQQDPEGLDYATARLEAHIEAIRAIRDMCNKAKDKEIQTAYKAILDYLVSDDREWERVYNYYHYLQSLGAESFIDDEDEDEANIHVLRDMQQQLQDRDIEYKSLDSAFWLD